MSKHITNSSYINAIFISNSSTSGSKPMRANFFPIAQSSPICYLLEAFASVSLIYNITFTRLKQHCMLTTIGNFIGNILVYIHHCFLIDVYFTLFVTFTSNDYIISFTGSKFFILFHRNAIHFGKTKSS